MINAYYLFITFIFNFIISQIKSIPILCQNNQRWIPSLYTINQNQTYVWTKLGFPIIVDQKDLTISYLLKRSGCWQPNLVNFIRHLVKPGDKVINLGSHIGYESIIMGKIINKQQNKNPKLYIFEPYSFSYKLMKKNIILNDLGNITISYNFGVSNVNSLDIGMIFVSQSNTGSSQISKFKPYLQNKQIQFKTKQHIGGIKTQQVLVIRPDMIIPQEEQIDFVLIDVQGMQLQALDGMSKIIQKSPNLVILTQWQIGIYPKQKQKIQLLNKVFNFFQKRSYKLYNIEINSDDQCQMPSLKQIKSIKDAFIQKDTNILIIPSNKQFPKY